MNGHMSQESREQANTAFLHLTEQLNVHLAILNESLNRFGEAMFAISNEPHVRDAVEAHD